MVMLPMTLGDP